MTEAIDLTQDNDDFGINSTQNKTSRPVDNHQLELNRMVSDKVMNNLRETNAQKRSRKEQQRANNRSQYLRQPTVIKDEDTNDYRSMENLESEDRYVAAPKDGRYRSNKMPRQMPLNFNPTPRHPVSSQRDHMRRDSRMDNQFTPFRADFQAPGRESTADMDGNSNSLFVDQGQDVFMTDDQPSRKRRRNLHDTLGGPEYIHPSIENVQQYGLPSAAGNLGGAHSIVESGYQQNTPPNITSQQQKQLDKYINQQQPIPPSTPKTPTPLSRPRGHVASGTRHTPASGPLGAQARSQRRGHGAQTFKPNGNSFVTQEDVQRMMTDLMEATNQFRTATNQVLDMAQEIHKLKDDTKKQLAEMNDHMNKSFKDAAEQTSKSLENHLHSIEELQGGFLNLEEKLPDLVAPTRGGAYGGSKTKQQPKSSGLFNDLLNPTEPRGGQTPRGSQGPRTATGPAGQGSSSSQTNTLPNGRRTSLGPMTGSPARAPAPAPAPASSLSPFLNAFSSSVQNGVPPSGNLAIPGQFPAGGGGGSGSSS